MCLNELILNGAKFKTCIGCGQVRTREQKIDELTGICNNLQLQSGQLIEENASLRDKLGIPHSHHSGGESSSSSTIRGDKNIMFCLFGLKQAFFFR